MQTTTAEVLNVHSWFENNSENQTEKNNLVSRLLWTQDDYYRMSELGFFDEKKVELIEGEIFEMSPMNKPHATAVRKPKHKTALRKNESPGLSSAAKPTSAAATKPQKYRERVQKCSISKRRASAAYCKMRRDRSIF